MSESNPTKTQDPIPGSYLVPYYINRLSNRFSQVWLQTIRDYGLTMARWHVLSVLYSFRGSSIRDIAKMCAAEQPVISRVVSQLEKLDLASRRPSRDDHRGVEVWPTDKALELFEELQPRAMKFVGWTFGNRLNGEIRKCVGGIEIFWRCVFVMPKTHEILTRLPIQAGEEIDAARQETEVLVESAVNWISIQVPFARHDGAVAGRT